MGNIEKLEQVNLLRKSQTREREKLDNLLFAVTAGTLSISITFISSSLQTFSYLKYLFSSWIVLLVGLSSILLAYQVAISHFRYTEKMIEDNEYDDPNDMDSGWRFYLSETLNWISLICVIVGIALFAYFGYLNVK